MPRSTGRWTVVEFRKDPNFASSAVSVPALDEAGIARPSDRADVGRKEEYDRTAQKLVELF